MGESNQRRSRVGRPIFRRKLEYVAVRPLRLGSNLVLQPGDRVDDKVRPHHLRSLYQRRKIGPVGHGWTEAMLESKGFNRPEITGTRKSKPKSEPKIEKVGNAKWSVEGTDEIFRTKKAAKAWVDAREAFLDKCEEENDDWLDGGGEDDWLKG